MVVDGAAVVGSAFGASDGRGTLGGGASVEGATGAASGAGAGAFWAWPDDIDPPNKAAMKNPFKTNPVKCRFISIIPLREYRYP